MKPRVESIFLLFVVCFPSTMSASSAAAKDVNINSARSLYEAARTIEKQYQCRITYEDPIYSGSDLESDPTGITNHLVPRSRPIAGCGKRQ